MISLDEHSVFCCYVPILSGDVARRFSVFIRLVRVGALGGEQQLDHARVAIPSGDRVTVSI